VERTRTINRLTAHSRSGCVRDSMEIKAPPLLRILLFFCVKLLLFGVQVSPNTCISSESQDQVRASIKSISSPHAPSLVKWAIVCLAKPDSSGSIFLRNEALISSLRPYASKHDITVIFFSEQLFPPIVVKAFENSFKNVAKVKFLDTSSRGFMGERERFGYKYMCKFFSLDMYDFLREYDYYMRCDTDCYLKKLDYDILNWAETSKVGYGYSIRKLEAHGPTRLTLPLWTQKYLRRCNLEPMALMDKPLSVCFNFYNNWHIGRVSFFNRPDVRHYLEAVNSSGHILKDRWGDSTIQAYAVRIFMDPKHIIMVPNFSYVHGSHSMRVSTFDNGDTNVPQTLPRWKHSLVQA